MPKIIRLTLSREQRADLDRRLRERTAEHRAHERLLMIRAVADGATIPQAAATLGHHEQTVRKFVSRFLAEGFAGLADRPRAGRPPRLREVDLAAVEARLDADAAAGTRTWTLPQLAAWLAEERGGGGDPGPPRGAAQGARLPVETDQTQPRPQASRREPPGGGRRRPGALGL